MTSLDPEFHLAFLPADAVPSAGMPGRLCDALTVTAAANDGRGGAWEFKVIEEFQSINGWTTQLLIYSDAYTAFTQIPDFFTAMATTTPSRLTDVTALLTDLGAVNMRPTPHGPLLHPEMPEPGVDTFGSCESDRRGVGGNVGVLTDDDLARIATEFAFEVDLARVRAVLTEDHIDLIYLGRLWGWADTEVRDQLCALPEITD
ncbi:hypothetical protein [Nocardia suismassiliense]|uniref:hypothetical protein n=1 Tax=Nocardia suismassiliense TaxID=2077092 RepID=UPI000D1F04FE|nr:hypothetical protein [Nocardia suismassiliense]